jgi:superfamily II DNA or RNA helicase
VAGGPAKQPARSRQEAQRLGRILRPKADGGRARFYTVVSRDTNDRDYAQRRQRFLAEQGDTYQLVDAAEVLAEPRRRRPAGSGAAGHSSHPGSARPRPPVGAEALPAAVDPGPVVPPVRRRPEAAGRAQPRAAGP